MRMSSSMYEVFNWNSSPDPPLTPAKHKRASLSLPPTTDIFAIDDKSDSDTRRPMIQRAASGESWSQEQTNQKKKKKKKSATGKLFCCPRMSYRYISLSLVLLAHRNIYISLASMSLSFNAIKKNVSVSSFLVKSWNTEEWLIFIASMPVSLYRRCGVDFKILLNERISVLDDAYHC